MKYEDFAGEDLHKNQKWYCENCLLYKNEMKSCFISRWSLESQGITLISSTYLANFGAN